MNWTDIAGWAEQRLDLARQRLESELDPVETAKCRARIALLKELLALPEAVNRSQRETQASLGTPE